MLRGRSQERRTAAQVLKNYSKSANSFLFFQAAAVSSFLNRTFGKPLQDDAGNGKTSQELRKLPVSVLKMRKLKILNFQTMDSIPQRGRAPQVWMGAFTPQQRSSRPTTLMKMQGSLPFFNILEDWNADITFIIFLISITSEKNAWWSWTILA